MNEIYSKYCKRCGRLLEDEQSKRRGYGNSCYTKHLREQNPQLSLFKVKRSWEDEQ